MNETEYNRLPSESKKSMFVSHTLAVIVLILAAVLSGLFIKDYRPFIIIVIHCCITAFALFLIVRPVLYYRFYRYAITDDRIDVRQGVVIRTHTVVPIERLHQVEVVRGPINGMFGLANVNVTTAGGVAKIKFLKEDVAESIVDGLNNVINKIIRDRNSDA